MRTILFAALLGCASTEKGIQDTNLSNINIDNDNDGFSSDEDCDDSDPESNPGAEEICDGIDNNCDGDVDEGVTSTFYADSDNDGYGNAEITMDACEEQEGFVANGSDCDDTSEDSYPSAEELCDGLDNDCDDDIDEDLDVDFYVDSDDDGFGDDNNIVSGCSPDMGLSTIGGDCDDSDASISPLANEICDEVDNNCNGSIDEDVTTTYYADVDGDSYGDPTQTMESCEIVAGYVSNNMDCDDVDSDIHPTALEFCDTIDNDCDGDTDEEGAVDGLVWYEDGDEDTYGDENSTLVACTQPTGYVSDSSDCDDNSYLFYPGAPELCNGFDDNCDGNIDEDGSTDATTWFADHDGDGFGNSSETLASCEQPIGYTLNSTDCDDDDDDVYPGASEVCDGEDNDCDDTIDESDATDAQTWFIDNDSDGFGDPSQSETSCVVPNNGVLNSDDCDDSTSAISPDASEECDSIDNDCDGSIDENDAIDQTAWYEDGDGDGFGLFGALTIACDAPVGHVADASDCDDANSTIHPDAEEVCDTIDNDCNGIIDGEEATDSTMWYIDYDGDTYGSTTISMAACMQPNNFVANFDDCDDTNAAIYASNTEICDGLDNDCNGTIDDDTVLTYTTWYEDDDGDTYGNNNSSVLGCSQPSGYVEDNTDCDDSDSSVNPLTGCGSSCQELYDQGYTSDGSYIIDPDGYNTGEGPIEVYCDMTTDGGGWTLCASLTKGYVPAHMLHDEDMYAFQARLNSSNDYVYEQDAPGRSNTTWEASEELNYGQFCRYMGTSVSQTWITAKMYNYGDNYAADIKGSSYSGTYSGMYSGNLFMQWFTNSASARTFTRLSGDQLYIQLDDGSSYVNSSGAPYIVPTVSWSGTSNGQFPYTHTLNPWYSVDSSVNCTGCTANGSGYNSLHYDQTTILNDLSHSFWSGIPNVEYGWSDCTNNGNCNYHESGMGVWLFYVR